ncbi:MAG: type II toxin-antitoxin system MqsA family antitoxin [Sideroxyarcus sp.]|nr:type II toxin-antitoxin system MqsA family antitoxin [Sideroxyarcus sp.]
MMLTHLTNEHGKSKPVAAVVNLFRILDKHRELVEEIRY